MAKKIRRLPKVIRYSGKFRDYKVQVEEVSRNTIEELNPGADGYWDDGRDKLHGSEFDARILICKEIEPEEKWWTFWHERGHAWLDLWARDKEAEEDD